jgi:hypothetical protein
MKRILHKFFVVAALAAGATVLAQAPPEIPYDASVDLSLPQYGEVAGVATNSKGDIFVYARTGESYATLGGERTFYHGGSRLFQFDRTGKFIRTIGADTYAENFAQQVRVDPQDNVWAVDAGSMMVVKYDPNGKFLMAYGRKPESIPVRPPPGVPARRIDPAPPPPAPAGQPLGGAVAQLAPGQGVPGDSFSNPSDVAFDKAGNAYIADGFGNNNRVAKFGPDGNFILSWGQTGQANGQFNRVRGIAADAAGNIYVADAGNTRIQVFDSQGNYKSQITGVGTPEAICITTSTPQYLYSSNSNDPERMDNGEIYKLTLDGKIVGRFGRAGRVVREFGMVNAIDCRTDNNLLLGEVWNWRVQKVTLKPTK